ncbi:ATP-binding protein [Nocardia sp. NPDC051321]|uniref:ATP-binding protein n=1 Tax=Nocardia sp. NPDC051321 TaxID=3364323 RepID=UPI00378EB06E
MNTLAGFSFHRVLTTPASVHERGDSADSRVQLFAALAAAHAELLGRTDAAFAVAWERTTRHSDIRVLIGGRPSSPVAEPGEGVVPVMYPPGGTGHRLDTEAVVARWRQQPVWLRCPGRSDALWSRNGSSTAAVPRRGCFEDYVAHLPGVFVWLVIAEPLPASAIEAELAQLEVRLPQMRARENSEPDRVALLRGESRFRELTRSISAGMWSVHVLVGGVDDRSVRRAAGLLCSASDLDDLPYVLTPDTTTGALDQTWPTRTGTAGFTSPFTASAELLAGLARPPRRELPGIRAVEPALFDLTPEHDGEIALGAILDDADQPVGQLDISLDTLNRHTFIAGATGSGKSQTVRHLLTGLSSAEIPWLVIEPAKAEYAAMSGRIGAPVAVIRPGDPDAIPMGLNPLEPERGFPVQTHLDLVRALFSAAFDAAEPFPQVLSHALTRCYTELGWDTVLSAPSRDGPEPRFPRLSDLQAMALTVVDGIGYGREITDNVRGFIDVRIGALRLGTPGRFFEGGYRLDITDLLRHNVVLEIEDIGNDADKAFFIGVILIRVFENLRVHRSLSGNRLRHVMVVEEAHRLLRRAEPGTPAAHAVELFASLLAEIRAYGEGIIVAEQIPAKIAADVVKNSALKIVHRLPAAEDREIVGATMNLDPPQSRHLVTLPPGRAAVFTDGMDRPLRIEVPLGHDSNLGEHPQLWAALPGRLTLRDLHRARRIREQPDVALWIELMVLAHLVGRPAPRPREEWLHTLTTNHPPILLTEAVTGALEEAIDARYAGLAHYFPPEELIAHLQSTATAALNGAPTCDGTENHWQAGSFRWADVERALHAPDLRADMPHPMTPEWARRGLVLDGATLKAQLDILHAHPDSWADRRIVTGPARTPRLAELVATLSHATSPDACLHAATRHLDPSCRWALTLLESPDRPNPQGEP